MNINKLLIVLGEPNSIFSEILFKYFKKNKSKSFRKKIILIGNNELLIKQMKKLNFRFNINLIENINHAKANEINMINVNFKFKKEFTKISSKSNEYLTNCFDLAIHILKNNKQIALLNGPVSKANNSRNYTQCDSLLMGNKCGAHTVPYIKNKNSESNIAHEATTSKISEEQLHYCQQRGLNPEEAVGLIVNGFCKEVLQQLPMEFAVEAQKLVGISLEGSVG